MMRLMDHELSAAQRQRLTRFKATECVDIHCHCLPGLDDGPPTLDDALELCRALVQDGITTAIATPHQLGRFDGSVASDDIRRAAEELNEALEAQAIPLAVVPGADIRLDERIPQLLNDNRILTLADAGCYLLIELPHETFVNAQPLLDKLAGRGITPILSHPERNALLAREPRAALPWLARGALMQVTAGSLLGKFGPAAYEAAWRWLAGGAASLVASDAHDTAERAPCFTLAMEAITRRLGHAAAFQTCIFNPLRVLTGKQIKPDARRLPCEIRP